VARGWLAPAALVVLIFVLALQKTKYAMLPRTQNTLLWVAVLAAVSAVVFLHSGQLRDAGWQEEQQRLGTIANNFYEPRRAWLVQGFAIGFGVLGGLWWGLATWSEVFRGMRRATENRGLLPFEIATLCGMLAGALVGACLGLMAGYLWETRHRRARHAGLAKS
jgi:Na+/proline symporter